MPLGDFYQEVDTPSPHPFGAFVEGYKPVQTPRGLSTVQASPTSDRRTPDAGGVFSALQESPSPASTTPVDSTPTGPSFRTER